MRLAGVAIAAIVTSALIAGSASSAQARTGSRISLHPMSIGVVHQPFPLGGVLSQVGHRRNKLVVLQQRINGAWRTVIRSRHHYDGPYQISAIAHAPGPYVFRTRVFRYGKRLATSGSRSLRVLASVALPPPPPPAAAPADRWSESEGLRPCKCESRAGEVL
jgi:hypothetical protein